MSAGLNTPLDASPLPSRLSVRTLIEDLIGRSVDLQDAPPMPAKPTNVAAPYVTDRLGIAAVAVVNLEGAARLGGALGMLPKGGVEDAIADKDLFEMLHSCCYEVLNVLAAAFNVPNAPHVRLYEMYGPKTPIPPDVAALAGTIGQRLDVKLSISGYGDGLLSIVVR